MAPSLAPAMARLASSEVHITLAPVPVASISPLPALRAFIDHISSLMALTTPVMVMNSVPTNIPLTNELL